MQTSAERRVEELEAELAALEARNASLLAARTAAEQRARAILEQAMFSVQILSPDGRTTYVNPAWERLTGATLADVQAIDYNVLADPQLEVLGIMPYIRRGFAGEAVAIPTVWYDARANQPDGNAYAVRAYIYPVLDAEGRVCEVVLMHQDVTAEVLAARELEDQRLRAAQVELLREADRAKDEFLSVISHELRTPLNFITGFASVLADEALGPLGERQREAVRKILNGADRMLLLVNDLLDFAKLQSGQFELVPAPTPFRPLVEEVVALMQPLADQQGLALTLAVDVPRAPVLDGGRVAQVLTNLISNALKFTPPGGAVTVRAAVREGLLRVEVADTGVGIAAEDLPKLFQRFRQLDMGKTREAGGTGLGLAIAKALVEAHGGEIGVESTPGRGSTFWFTLPR